MKKIILIFFLVILPLVSFGEEIKYREFSLEPGYKFTAVDGDNSVVSEYHLGGTSAFLSTTYKDLSSNYKIIFGANINEKDNRDVYFHLTYKDNLTIGVEDYYFIHNLGHKTLLYNPSIYDLSPNKKYSLDVVVRKINLKYKPFEYPLHFRLIIEDFERDGTIQKLFYGSSSFDPNILSLPAVQRNNIFSRDRQIGFEMERITCILDTILGGVGFVGEISSENFVNKHKNSIDSLLNYPLIKKADYGIKLYSNLTGQITWSAYLVRNDSKNGNRDELGREGASVTQTDSAFLLSYYPKRNLKFSLKVGYTDRDQDNPDTVRFLGSDIAGIKDAVSFNRKTAEFNVWYGFLPELNVKLTLKRKETKRSFNDFGLPEYSYTNTSLLSIDGKIKKGFTYKISQKIENNHNPVYKNTPEMSYVTSLNLSYDINVNSGLYLNSDYSFSRNDVEAQYFKKSWSYKHFINYWLNVNENLNLNVYGAYNNEKYISDVHFGVSAPTYIVDRNVPFQFTNYYAGINLNRVINSKNTFYTDFNYMRGYGTYFPHLIRSTLTDSGPPPVTYVFDTVGLDSLANTDFYQFSILLGNSYQVLKNAKLKLEFLYKDHIDKTNNPIEGTLKTVFVSWEQRW